MILISVIAKSGYDDCFALCLLSFLCIDFIIFFLKAGYLVQDRKDWDKKF